MLRKESLAVELVARLKSSEDYKCFKAVLKEKKRNENKAKTILIENAGNFKHNQLKNIIALVDDTHGYFNPRKHNNGPWFGRLLGCNTGSLLIMDEDEINKWFYILVNKQLSVLQKMDILQSKEFKIKGLNVGFITLMFYILDKHSYKIWFRGQHDGLMLIYPELQKFNGKNKQYIIFNEAANKFANQYHFDPEELDWVFSTGLPLTFGG